MNCSVLAGNAEAKFLGFDRIFPLCPGEQACFFCHLLRLVCFAQPLVSAAKLVVALAALFGSSLSTCSNSSLRPVPLLQLHVKQAQLVVRFHHRRLHLLGVFQRFHGLLLLAKLKRNQAKDIFERKITGDCGAPVRQYLQRFLIFSFFHVGLR